MGQRSVDLPKPPEDLFVDHDKSQGYDIDGPYATETLDKIRTHWSSIKTGASRRLHTSIYNIRIQDNDVRAALTGARAMSIFEEQTSSFKMNAAFGFLLVNYQGADEPAELRFWHPSSNRDRLHEIPKLITNRSEHEDFLSAISDRDLLEVITQNRPDSSWRAHIITNLTVYVYQIKDHCIGCPSSIPAYIRNNKAIVVADRDRKDQLRMDGLCFFRAIAISRNQKSNLEAVTTEYFRSFMTARAKDTPYEGVQLSDLPWLEHLYSLSVNVYRMTTDRAGNHQAELIVRSSMPHVELLNLHLQDNHFCLITDTKLYCRSYRCAFCEKLVKSVNLLTKHSLHCSPGAKLVYPNGVYKPSESLFSRLADVGIAVDEARHSYPYLVTFDTESYTDTSHLPKDSKTIHYEGRHRLACVSVCSNIAGHTEPICLVNREGEKATVNSLISHLHRLADVCETRLRLRYRDVFNRLTAKREELLEQEENTSGSSHEQGLEKIEKRFDRLETELGSFCQQLLVFTYNGGK